MRNITDIYPNFQAELEAFREHGPSPDLIRKTIEKHTGNALRTKYLFDRYQTVKHSVPIYNREPRFEGEAKAINNKVMNDFFSEIIDVKVGYFAGKPITYGYSGTEEDDYAGDENVERARLAVSDFALLNNMFDSDLETTKLASICGYAGRLFYIDNEGQERVLNTMPYETIVLSETDMMEPEFGIRYLQLEDIDRQPYYHVEFYDSRSKYTYRGTTLSSLHLQDNKLHFFDYCPLQGIPNNTEFMGDTERVLECIDAYDRGVSDSVNEMESFSNAYMVFENIDLTEEDVEKAGKSGAISFFNGTANGKVYFLTKQINDGFTEHNLDRLQQNIYRFSKTPDLSNESFGTASGVALKFRLTGLETKCGMFEAKLRGAGVYMFKLLASSWAKKRVIVDPLQCYMEFKRNFPLDLASEAQACSTLIGAGIPKRVAFSQLSFIDDVDYVMDQIDLEEGGDVPELGELDPMPEEYPDIVDDATEDETTEEEV